MRSTKTEEKKRARLKIFSVWMLHADADIGEEVIRKDDNGVDESNLDLNNDSTSDSDITVLID